MPDPGNTLQALFQEANRYANFGDMLLRIRVQGFRCHTNTIIDINNPITAFCGLNGTGKSTLLQLAAAAYRNPDPNLDPYYIKDFLVVSPLDPTPFTSTAKVEYQFWQEDRSRKSLTLSRNSITNRWQGYPRRPIRKVLFAGIGLYLPKIEQRDFIVRNANQLAISSSDIVADRNKEAICTILGHSYDRVVSNTVTYSHRSGKVVTVQRAGVTYSEAHMGYGEGRTQYLVSALETFPDKSLVLIEEPETSLHPSAQHEFGKYLVDVAIRKRHQILLTTHSEFILEALPPESRIYLNKKHAGIDTIPGLTALQARSLMAQGHVKALHVLVEDNCAAAILREIIRRVDPEFLRSTGFCEAGDADTIGKTVKALKDTGLPVVAVRDGDKGAASSDNIYKLPGTLPPEKEIFGNAMVKEYVFAAYGVDLNDFSVSLRGVDHHDWFARLADFVNKDETALVGETAAVYARSLTELEVSSLVRQLKGSQE